MNKTPSKAIPLQSSINPGDRMTAPFRVVLHQLEYGRPGEWVTHIENMQCGGFHWGHYFFDYAEAVLDYLERCTRERVEPFENMKQVTT